MIDANYSVINLRAQELANRAIICCYTESEDAKDYFKKRMVEDFERVADALGYDIVKRETK